jgi:deazaflavin-dependent oxidoreductase (nitroreductase family)
VRCKAERIAAPGVQGIDLFKKEKVLRLSMRRGDFKRWLYRGQRPNWIARMLNRAWAALFSSGILPDYMATLEVTGRKSGRTVSLPVAVTVVNGQRYLVSMLGENVHWVQNVRAAGGKAVLRRHGREEVLLVEVPTGQRAPILKAYLQRAPGGALMCL